ncbi:MAG: AMP-binding protein [Porticoccaceae bacterium]
MSSPYQQLRDSFSWQRPQQFNFARDIIDNWAEQNPDHLAIHWVDDNGNQERVTFAQVAERSRQVANLLTSLGVARGETILLLMGRQLAWWEATTAGLRMGAVVSPGTTQLSAKDISYRINAAKATCVLADRALCERIDSIAEQCPTLRTKIAVANSNEPEQAAAPLTEGWHHYEHETAAASAQFVCVDTASDDDALCYFTSGTTGYPKMCIHNHLYGTGHITTGKYWLDLTADDLHWNLSDTGWAKAAWSSYFGPWLCGAAIFVHHARGFDPAQSLEMFARYPITTFCGAPTIYRMFVLQNLQSLDFGSLRHCVGAGEPLNPEVISVWQKATELVIRDGYGQTESVILCGNMPSIEPKFGSMGKPMPGIDLAVIDEHGNRLVDQEGDIAVAVAPQRPIGLFKEYRGEPEKTAKCFRGDWYLTGDRAIVDSDGYFWFVGRSDDVILSSGYRIGPFEVESALLEHAAVAESAVVASPDPDRGEVVKAFIVLAAGHTASDALIAELQAHVKAVTAPYKYPRKIEFVDLLPKTVSGKIRRVELREKEWAQ